MAGGGTRPTFSENLQGRGAISARVRLHDNCHILVERYQEAQKAFHGKLPELTAQHLRNIGLAESEQPAASTCLRGGTHAMRPHYL